MSNISSCTLPACDQSNLSSLSNLSMMARQDLVEFGFNDLINVVAYSVMSGGKGRNLFFKPHSSMAKQLS